MNSEDDYFDDLDSFDASALAEIDAIESAQLTSTAGPSRQAAQPPRPPLRAFASEDSFSDLPSFNFDEDDLKELDHQISNASSAKQRPVAGTSKPVARTNSTKQLTLFGDVLPDTQQSKPRSQIQHATTSHTSQKKEPVPQRVLEWDYRAFSEASRKRAQNKVKGKTKADVYPDEEDDPEFEQFPAPVIPREPPPPMKLEYDALEVKHWYYPINKPKRDYQYNIIKNCLFENTLVALPTGLGKTFVAGVLMLNYYRWFPNGKVIFAAPTRPLVAQQIKACHETCGISPEDSVEITGSVTKTNRAAHWEKKRVFFLTPQTLQNDLFSGICDPRDIVLLVLDEAHRATGNYAYNQVVQYLMAKNPHFRLLALTATPGNKTESVQALITGLHLSHIEIRNDESLDIQPYIHQKIIKTHVITPNAVLAKVQRKLADIIDSFMKTVQQYFSPRENGMNLHPFRPTAIMRDQKPAFGYATFSLLSGLARAMMYLSTGSIGTCHAFLEELLRREQETGKSDGKPKGKATKKKSFLLSNNAKFHELMNDFQLMKDPMFPPHPKLEKLREILVQHFGKEMGEDGDPGTKSRVMVFSSFRDVVEEIYHELMKESPLIRPAQFIGQGVDKRGKKGLQQKDQLELIQRFQEGKFNVLIATSIGEEGLDIGEIDVIVCYDSDKTPTRMLQRFGRTGRKQDGIVHVLLAEGREESNISKAQDNHDMIVDLINKGRSLEVYKDVPRLIPDNVKPVCVEKKMVIHEVRPPSPKIPKKAGAKRKRNDDVDRNVPHTAFSGFVPVSKLVAKKKGLDSREGKTVDELATDDDEIDKELEEGPLGFLRRTNSDLPSTSTTTLKKGKGKASMRKAATEPAKPRIRKKKLPDPTSSHGETDDDDVAIEAGVLAASTAHSGKSRARPHPKKDPTPSPPRPSSRKNPISNDTVLELPDSGSENDMELAPLSPPNKRRKMSPLQSISFSSEDSEPDSGAAVVGRVLTKSQRRAASRAMSSPSPPPFQISSPPAPQNFNADNDMSWLVDDDDEPMPLVPLVSSKPIRMDRFDVGDESIEISSPRPTAQPASFKGMKPVKRIATPPLELSDSEHFSPPPKNPRLARSERDTRLMPPPPAPASILSPPAPSHPIRALQNKRRITRVIDDDDEEELEPPPPSQRRLQRLHSTPPRASKADRKGKEKEKPTKKAEKRAKPSLLSKDSRLIFEGEAAHSGDEVLEGDSNSEDDLEDEYDREFIKDSPMTQANDSYDQSYAYRKSLLTQMPSTARVPLFQNAPVKPKPFGRIDYNKRRHLVSSSPPRPDEEDTYEMDSFVVGDDEDIIFSDGHSSEMLEDF